MDATLGIDRAGTKQDRVGNAGIVRELLKKILVVGTDEFALVSPRCALFASRTGRSTR